MITVQTPEVVISVLIHIVFWRIMCFISGSWNVNSFLVTTVIAVRVLLWTAAQSPESGNKRPWNYSTNLKVEDKSKELIKLADRLNNKGGNYKSKC